MKEVAIQFGDRDRLVGTVTLPSVPSPRSNPPGLILMNAGIVHRIGPHRINVKLARHAASLGVPSLRFDLSGRGDSTSGRRELDYQQQAIADIQAAFDALAKTATSRRFALFGICSGADDAYAAALADSRVASVALFDPYVYPTLRWRIRINAARVRKFGLIGGLVRLRTMKRVQSSYEDSVLRNYGRKLPPLADYAAGLAALADRGVKVHLVYSGSSVDHTDYQSQRRMVLGSCALDQRIQAEFLPDVDHVITSLAAQRRVLARLDTWLGMGRTDHELSVD